MAHRRNCLPVDSIATFMAFVMLVYRIPNTWVLKSPLKQERFTVTNRTTSSPGPSPLSKWRGGRRSPWTRLQKYSKGREVLFHVTQDEMAFSEGFFQRLAAVSVFWSSKPVKQTKRRHFIMFYATKCSSIFRELWQPWPGFSTPGRPFWKRRRPGDELVNRLFIKL